MIAELFGVLDPAHIAEGQDAVVLVGHVIERIDHIVGAEIGPVVEFDVVAQFQIERGLVRPVPACRKKGFELAGLQITKDQTVPAHVPHDHQFTGIVVVRIDHRDFPGCRPIERVVSLVGKGFDAGKRQHRPRTSQH